MRDPHGFHRRWADYKFSLIDEPFPASDVPPPAAYPAPAYIHLQGRGTALVSDPVDQGLMTTSIPVQLAAEPYQLPEPLKSSAPRVLRVLNHGHLVFNGKIIGLRGDPLPPGAAPGPPVTLHVARFFDAQCSNEMCALRIAHRQTGEELDLRIQLLTNASGHLRTLAESVLADCVGISTVAFTADSQLVLVRQARLNTASGGLLAPSGSGSLDPRDLSAPGSLQDILRRGMERELREETGIRPDEIRATRVTGFARWLERGAKPEFFGITELSMSAKDLEQRRRLASDERPYTGGTFTASVDLPVLSQELGNGRDILGARSLPARIKEDGSLPLLLALRAAALSHPRRP